MRIQQLEYAIAVARSGSFRRAAEHLHISQPALSENVRRLETELGVEIIDRRRSGATISADGRELMPHLFAVIEAADKLKRAADQTHRQSRNVRVGTVTSATVPLLAPTIREFHERHPNTQVEILNAPQARIHNSLLEGSIDLGLQNYLEGDDLPPELESTELLRGRVVVCMRPENELARRSALRVADLWTGPLIAMRPGFVMHRYLTRLLAGREQTFSFASEGAEMGKQMVAAGLGIALFPEYSVVGDPLVRTGEIVWRPLADDDTEVLLVLQRRRSAQVHDAIDELHDLFVAKADGSHAAAAAANAA